VVVVREGKGGSGSGSLCDRLCGESKTRHKGKTTQMGGVGEKTVVCSME
jgi:hypothetical protein